jgi:nicotinate-nucleotide pyrophosphorylase (carboxylating)
VRHGGGRNHRTALYDGVLIKDNHIVAAGGIAAAVAKARAVAHPLLKIEVEVESLDELRQALDAGADVVLLDNMDDATLREAVKIAAGRAKLEASGGMTPERVARLAGIGVDWVSMGGLIHQARWVDLSMRIEG